MHYQRPRPESGESAPVQPERVLLTKALESAIRDATHKGAYVSNADHQAAIEWFRNPSDGVGGFYWYCDLLDLNPETLRAGVLEHIRTGTRPYWQEHKQTR